MRTSLVNIRSLRAMGTPCSGPLWRPAVISRSASDASSSARSAVTVMKAFVSSLSMRASNVFTTSTGERHLSFRSRERAASERGRSVSWVKIVSLPDTDVQYRTADRARMTFRNPRGQRSAIVRAECCLLKAIIRYHRRVISHAIKTLRRFDRRVWLLLFAMLAFRFGHGLYFPFSSIYFHNVLGIPLSLVGVGLAVFAGASVLSGLVAGPLTDRYGRKPVMLAALAGSSASFFAFSLVGGFAGYLVVSAGHGFVGWAMFEASRNAMVADVTPQGMRSRAFGLVRVGGNVGWALGPMVAGLVSATAGGSGGRLPEALRRNLGAYGGGGHRAGPWHQGVASRVERVQRERWIFRQVARGVLGRAFPGLARGRGIALLHLHAGLAGLADLRQELRRGGRRTDRVLPGGQRAHGHTVPASRVVPDRPGSRVVALLAGAGLFAASSATLLLTDSFLGIFFAFVLFFTLAEMVLEVAGVSLAAELAPVRLRGPTLRSSGPVSASLSASAPSWLGRCFRRGFLV